VGGAPRSDGNVFVVKNTKLVATRCQILKAKMHQIRFRLGFRLRLRLNWVILQRSPDLPLATFKETYLATSKGERERERRAQEGRAGKERERRGMTRALFNFLPPGAVDVG